MIEIIEATESDLSAQNIDQICGLLEPIFKKTNVGQSCNSFELRHLWESLLWKSTPATLFLLIDGPKILGLIGGFTFDDPLTKIRYAAEVMWRVSPEAGGQGWGLKLLQSFERWARENGCSRTVIHGSALDQARTNKKVSPLGYSQYQIEYMKEL